MTVCATSNSNGAEQKLYRKTRTGTCFDYVSKRVPDLKVSLISVKELTNRGVG